jgi:integrase
MPANCRLDFSDSFRTVCPCFPAAMATRNKDFPIVIKAGSSAVKIYKETKPNGEYYRVCYYAGGKRERLTFSSLEEAKTEARLKANLLSRGDSAALQLTGQDRLIYGRAIDAIRPFHVPLDAAAIEYAEARQILGSRSLLEAARFFQNYLQQGITGKPIPEAVAEFVEEKRSEGRSKLYLDDLQYRLGDFAKAFSMDVCQLNANDVRDFFQGLDFSPRSYNNHRRVLGTFFAYCQTRGWLSKDAELLGSVGKRKELNSEIEIFTPAELRSLLTNATPKMAICLALQAFAGIRSEEILRLSWQDLSRRPGSIEISSGKAKTAQRRLIPICDALASWLSTAPLGDRGENVWPHSKPFLFEAQRDTAKAAKIDWKKNALRHSFISYRLALIQNVDAVALEAGNKAGIIFKHYRQLATPAEAEEWFSVLPPIINS